MSDSFKIVDPEISTPAHYTSAPNGIEHCEALDAAAANWPKEIITDLTHAFGYIFRCGAKGSRSDQIKDLHKLQWWVSRAIQKLEKSNGN